MTVTIKDVAERAGVAPSTVSRVLSDSTSISQKTKKRVRRVMEEMNYVPNYNARRLASRQSQTIGLVLPQASDAFYQNPFFPTVLRGITEAASTKEYGLMLSTGDTPERRKKHVEAMVQGKQVAGLIFLYANDNDPILEFIKSINFPAVVMGTPENGQLNAVDNDNFSVAKELTEVLIQGGCRKLAYVGGDSHQYFVQKRLAGFKAALQEADLPFYPEDVYNDLTFLPRDGYQLMEDLLEAKDYDGLLIADHLVARGIKKALEVFHKHQVMTGTFKSFAAEPNPQDHRHPYFNLNSQQLGRRAVQILFDVLEDQANGSTRYLYEIVEAELMK